MLITSMSENIQANKQNKKVEQSRDKAEKNQPFLLNMNIPSDLNDIQPRSTKVWNCGLIGFYSNGSCNKVICTYNFFQVNEFGMCKQERDYHSGPHYLYLPEPVGNTLCLP